MRSGTKAVKIQGSTSGENVFYSLKDCPPALSLGIQVNEHKRPWIWMPDQLPYFVKADRVEDLTVFCPESAKIYADRVVENVPILNESITCSCLPAGVDPPEPSSSSWEGRPRAAGPEHPPSGDPVEPPGPAPKRPADLRDKKEGGKLRLKSDPKLPHFGTDELSLCGDALEEEADKRLDEEDAEAHSWSPDLRERLIVEARSEEHQLTHFPKNRYCETCRRSKMTPRLHRSHAEHEDPESHTKRKK